ncbi:MAG: FAD-dependent oxidoreductase [Rickettsiaceae bacterium]|nr:FAD-dependent oxidoreductase [Rickettsiaceae bacterium]
MYFDINKQKYFDEVIIGGGGAGLTAAIKLASNNRKVAILSKTKSIFSNTSAAQGGINANFGNQVPDDWRWHLYDTINAGGFLVDQDSAEILCQKANESVLFLQKIGVKFDLDQYGKIFQKKYGGQTTHFGSPEIAQRACSVSDRTGSAIMDSLYLEAQKLGVNFFDYHQALDLIVTDDICCGVNVYDINQGEIVSFFGSNIIIATGGYSQIYKTSTSSSASTGDGIRLISNLGFALKDMEFVQFHPTSMRDTGILISETARSIGGFLLNSSGERFMENYSEIYKELSARDVVSKAIFKESNKLKEHIFLDLRHVDQGLIEQKIGYVNLMCKYFLGLDFKKDLVPIKPVAHYCMGGIPTNKDCQVIMVKNRQENPITGLYAIGESACHSVHGAGRLGCNSLLDIIVFGSHAAEHILSSSHKTPKCSKNQKISITPILNKSSGAIVGVDINSIINDIKLISDSQIGIVRNHDDLVSATKKLESLHNKLGNLALQTSNLKWNLDLLNFFEAESLLICAKHVAYSALSRKESRASHYRSDFEKRDDKAFCKHSFSTLAKSGAVIEYLEPRTSQEYVEFFPLEKENKI